MSDFPVNFTESAAQKIHELLSEEENDSLKLRVSVTGGGCSGFQYDFQFDDVQSEDDILLVKQLEGLGTAQVGVLIDVLSMGYLRGATIDYYEDIHGEQFVITGNPNAKTTCSCGASFSTE